MAAPYKFGYLDSSKLPAPFEYDHTWAIEQTSGPARLIIAPRCGQIELMRALLDKMAEPFQVLYVFLVPRTERMPGRYQGPHELRRTELDAFLNRFETFFEGDGRHDLWIRSATDSSLLVYDQHNVIYAYGPLESFKGSLASLGLREVPAIRFPDPHVHNYRAEFEADPDALLDYWEWKVTPLTEHDDR